jgi:nicotinamide-nucleotide amidase
MNAEQPSDWTEAEARALHARLCSLGVKVAAAESLTVGRVQAELGRLSGASAYFAGGLTAYEIAAKINLLEVDEAHAREVNAVSARVAAAMARGAAKLFGSDIGVATTGYAEPDPSRGVTTPYAWVAVARGEEPPHAVRVDGAGLGREAMQARAATVALRLLAERATRPG